MVLANKAFPRELAILIMLFNKLHQVSGCHGFALFFLVI
ncbi:hypothetical protein HMPREF1229_1075 [Streptococcus pyogenes GA40634]|nr:hypothetical protein HMPREF1229_1075 [Streptococcus pyogenes GA40634]